MDSLSIHARKTIMLNQVRALIIGWLKVLSHRRMANSLFGDDSPWDLEILPAGFPFHNFAIRKGLRWTPAFAAPRGCGITFEHNERTEISSVRWTIQSRDVVFGVFEIPPQIYDDPLRPFVIEGMLKSVAADRAIGIIAIVETHEVQDGPYLMKALLLGGAPRAVDHTPARTTLQWPITARPQANAGSPSSSPITSFINSVIMFGSMRREGGK
ncbi:hypothetical protein B0H17DRAFT_1199214 [Mycena rosella]|uniref:Uncharacterized protein n=1 Tax=Mycena rosella TaxID=1033263 RepID=A0AAD7DL63_MYCRO|nr:hypothetical protein B0H17DRAFT_1199214 [Mycena rosella]